MGDYGEILTCTAGAPARSEWPSDVAAGPRESSTENGTGGATAENPFDFLPDELVQRIFSELEALEAFKQCRLRAVDRRFRRLVQGVHWKELRVVQPPRGGEPEEAVQHFTQLAKQAVHLLKCGALHGTRRFVCGIDIRLQLLLGLAAKGVEIRNCQDAASAATKLLGTLAVSPVPLEEVEIRCPWSGGISPWPSDEEQRRLGFAPLSPERIACSFLVALSAAPSMRSLTSREAVVRTPAGCSFGNLLLKSAIPGAVPPLQRLELDGAFLSNEEVAAIHRLWPGLQSFSCTEISGGAASLQIFAKFEDLRELDTSLSESEEIDAALIDIASSPCATRLRVFDVHHPWVGPAGLSAMLSLLALQQVSLAVDSRSADIIGGLANLPDLRYLWIALSTLNAMDGGARLLGATASAIEQLQCKRLESCEIQIVQKRSSAEVVTERTFIDQSAAAMLVRAASPSLRYLQLGTDKAYPSPELLTEVARGGPKLTGANLFYNLQDLEGANMDALVPLLRLRNCTSVPGLSLRINVFFTVSDTLWKPACSVIGGWFRADGPVVVSISSSTVQNSIPVRMHYSSSEARDSRKFPA